MDAVMFHLKGAHLAVQGVGRTLLKKFPRLTPARFDLMTALGERGMRQCDLWKRLRVVRSVISEMLRALLEMAWVKRVRAADGRSWLVQLTRRGREVLESAYAAAVDNGDATTFMHAGLTKEWIEADSQQAKLDFIFACEDLRETFRVTPRFQGGDLYGWHPEDYWTCLTDSADPTEAGQIPWVSGETEVAE